MRNRGFNCITYPAIGSSMCAFPFPLPPSDQGQVSGPRAGILLHLILSEARVSRWHDASVSWWVPGTFASEDLKKKVRRPTARSSLHFQARCFQNPPLYSNRNATFRQPLGNLSWNSSWKVYLFSNSAIFVGMYHCSIVVLFNLDCNLVVKIGS